MRMTGTQKSFEAWVKAKAPNAYFYRNTMRQGQGKYSVDVPEINLLWIGEAQDANEARILAVEHFEKRRKNPMKPLSEMTPSALNSRLTSLQKKSSKINEKFIRAGRGSERPSEIWHMSDELAQEYKYNSTLLNNVRDEITRRYGPGMSRAPIRRKNPVKTRKNPITPGQLESFVYELDGSGRDELKTALKDAVDNSNDYRLSAAKRKIYADLAKLIRKELKKFSPSRNPKSRGQHWIVTIRDTTNNQNIGSTYFDGSMTAAKKYFRKEKTVSEYWGQPGYVITMQPNAIVLWDGYQTNPSRRKKNPETEIRELILWAENTEALSNQFTSIMKNLERKAKKGIYDPVLAAKLWLYWIDEAVKSYNKEILGGGYSLRQNVFTMEDRRKAAVEVEHQWRDDVFYDIKKNPSRRGKNPISKLLARKDLQQATRNFAKATAASRKHSNLTRNALEQYGDHGPQISGVIRNHFPTHVKDELRILARSVTEFSNAAYEARPKGVRQSTMQALGREVATRGGSGFYGPQGNSRKKNPKPQSHILFIFNSKNIWYVGQQQYKKGANWTKETAKKNAYNFFSIAQATRIADYVELKKGEQIGIAKRSDTLAHIKRVISLATGKA